MKFSTKVKALRIVENEHMLIRHLMNDWFNDLEEARELNQIMALALKIKTIREKMRVFLSVLKKHQEKEEKFLFPVLGAYVGTSQGPVITIEAEHDEMNQYFEHFMSHATPDKTVDEVHALLTDLNEGFEILMVHMYKEESVLFTIAEKVLKIKDEEILLESMSTLIYE